jgi:hypothetical protein
MGWTYLQSGRDRIDIIRQQLNYETDAYAQQVIDHAVVGTTVYLLVQRTPKGEWQPSSTYVNDADGPFRWIAIFLTRKSRDAYDFGYKDMEESMGPVEARCPKRLIAAASPLRHPDPAGEANYAARWRQKCLDLRAAETKRKAELVHGATIRLSRVLDFTDGYKGDHFTIAIIQRRGRNRTYFRAPDGGLYRIRNLDAIGYRVEPDPA